MIAKTKTKSFKIILQNYIHKVIMVIILCMKGNRTSQKAQNIYFTNKNQL